MRQALHDGTSWANAYADLAQALLSQQSFNEVWVAEGTYLPGTIKSASFILPPNVQVYGGFAGNETLRTQRNVVANPTILSGDIGTQGNSSDNSYHVVVPSQGSTLDGFTVKDGNASKNFGNDDRGIGGDLRRRSHLRRLQLYLHGQPFPSKRRSRLPQGLQRDLRGL